LNRTPLLPPLARLLLIVNDILMPFYYWDLSFYFSSATCVEASTPSGAVDKYFFKEDSKYCPCPFGGNCPDEVARFDDDDTCEG